MAIYFELFDVCMSLGGGILIGLATTLNLFLLGKLTGMSSMTYTIFTLNFKEGLKTKLCLLFGLLTATFPFFITKNTSFSYSEGKHYFFFDQAPTSDLKPIPTNGEYLNEFWMDTNIYWFGIGALLVGLGTKLGNGCTSGHAVCGIPRLSLRSLIATCLFLFCGIAIATIKHQIGFLETKEATYSANDFPYPWVSAQEDYRIFGAILCAIIGVIVIIVIVLQCSRAVTRGDKLEPLLTYIIGIIFGFGLLIGGMCRRSKIIHFLAIGKNWDPSLVFVMVGAIGVNMITFNLILKREAPILHTKFDIPSNKKIEWNIIVGPIIFGLGWGMSGFCPGPAMVNLPNFLQMVIFVPLLGIGQYAASKVLPLINGCMTKKETPALIPQQ